MTPRISVVIASVNGPACILECLERLQALPERDQMEILVLDRREDDTAKQISERFPRVRLRAGLFGKSIPELRWMGMQAAKGAWIAVIEDHCMVTPGWAAEILRFDESPYGVVGGPVENGSCDRIVDRAFFLAEYGPCMPPLETGEKDSVPGNNVAYRRAILPLEEPIWANLWESFLQNNLRRKVVRIFLNPAMLVYHKKSFGLSEMLRQRWHYSRSFAAMKGAETGIAGRFIRGALSAALPLLLFYRIVHGAVAKRRNLKGLVLGLPIVALFVISWAAGEAAGYWLGPGDSLSRVE